MGRLSPALPRRWSLARGTDCEAVLDSASGVCVKRDSLDGMRALETKTNEVELRIKKLQFGAYSCGSDSSPLYLQA